MNLHSILRAKGSDVMTIHPEATLEDAVQTLVEHNIGSLLVVGGDRNDGSIIGILTERDILRACAAGMTPLDRYHVSEAMTADPIVGTIEHSVEQTMGVMTEHRIRHLPIVEDGLLVGIISIGDVVKAQHDELTMENHYLKNYIQS